MDAKRFELNEERGTKEKPGEAYEEYLLLLQQRNRLLKKLKEKDEKQLDLERKEQGFSLYLNGANVDLQVSGHHRSRKTKTAGERSPANRILEHSGRNVRTAPSKPTRKGWNQDPIDKIKIKTEKGEKVTVDLPDICSGKYSEDFELYQSYLETQLEEENESESGSENEDEEEFLKSQQNNADLSSSDSEVDEDFAKLTFTVQDVKALRQSLEKDTTIQKSIASITEELDLLNSDDDAQNNTGYGLEEIEEEVLSSNENESESDDNNEVDVSEEILEVDEDIETDSMSIEKKTHNEIIVEKEVKFDVKKNPKQPVLFQLSGATPKSRPISASRKRVEERITTASSHDIALAMEEENRRLKEYQEKREIHSAPVRKPCEESIFKDERNELKTEQRPQTIADPLSENDIVSITEKVRKMTGRQQRKLLNLLSEIETVDNPVERDWDDKKEKSKIFLQEDKKDRSNKDTKKSENLKPLFEASSKHDEREDSLKWAECRQSTNIDKKQHQKIKIEFEFSSNWGNKDFIGLTEIQVKDINNKLLKINEEDIKVSSQHNSKENIQNIIKQKTKTTKEKHMWKCDCLTTDDLRLTIYLRDIEIHLIKEVIMWNYNRSLQDLNVGVKDCRILIDGATIWEGLIEKGCGNQIFDYSKSIIINESPSNNNIEITPDSSCLVLSPSDSPRSANVASDSPRSANVVSDSPRSVTRTLQYADVNTKGLPEVISTKSSIEKNEKVNSSTSINVYDEVDDKAFEDIKFKPINERPSSTTPSGKPMWLEEIAKPKVEKQSLDIIENTRPRSRPSSGRRSQLSNEAHVEQPRTPNTGRRSKQTTPDQLEDEEIDELFDLNSKPKRPKSGRRNVLSPSSLDKEDSKGLNVHVQPSVGRQSPLMIDLPTQEDGSLMKSERQKFKELMDINLEQSFQSIDNFKFHHLGRLTATLDQDDDFGSLLEPIREKDKKILDDKMNQNNLDDQGEVLDDEDDGLDDQDEGLDVLDEQDNETFFDFPVLPHGKELIINIKTTWGDRHYVGLNGIEVFSENGELVKVAKIQANPSNINILTEYEGDPRVVENLTDGCYLTRDDMHLWLTPYTMGNDHLVELQFDDEINIAMIRIWNYNKSRIHSTRGARFVELALDGKLIFIGEIARASGVLSSDDPYGDTILFTTDEDILERVANNDFTYEVDTDDDEDALALSGDFTERPRTADKDTKVGRPFTCPKSRESSRQNSRSVVKSNVNKQHEITKLNIVEEDLMTSSSDEDDGDDGFMQQCNSVTINFLSTWGDQYYLGLTGLEVLGETFERIPLTIDMLEAIPRDLNDLDDYDDDDRTLDKLINNVNVTMHDENMWMIPFNEEEGSHILRINFSEPCVVTGIRVWNYNKSTDDTFRGARSISIMLDDVEVSPKEGFLLRKGPGHCHFDFAQDLLFNLPDSVDYEYPESSRHRKINLQKMVNEYETLMVPSGFVFQFKFFSSWGDPYYMGLNGIEVYDMNGQLLQLTDNNITAFPHSVNVLEGVSDDVRTPDKLINGINDTYDGRNMWLSPILPTQANVVYIVFDEPVRISMIKLWNYSKTPTRGVRQFGLLVDDLLVYSGVLPQCALYARAILPGLDVPVTHHTILFTDAEEIAMKEKNYLLSSSIVFNEQSIQLTNEKAVLQTWEDKNEIRGTADQALRPATSVKSSGMKMRR